MKKNQIEHLKRLGQELKAELANIDQEQKNHEQSTAILFQFLQNFVNAFKKPILQKFIENHNKRLMSLDNDTIENINKISQKAKKVENINEEELKALKMNNKHIKDLKNLVKNFNSEKLNAEDIINKLTSHLNDEKEVEKHQYKNTQKDSQTNLQRVSVKHRQG